MFAITDLVPVFVLSIWVPGEYPIARISYEITSNVFDRRRTSGVSNWLSNWVSQGYNYSVVEQKFDMGREINKNALLNKKLNIWTTLLKSA